jgi:hypothetical protein
MFSSPSSLGEKLKNAKYLTDETILWIIYLAAKMRRPAKAADTHVERLQ